MATYWNCQKQAQIFIIVSEYFVCEYRKKLLTSKQIYDEVLSFAYTSKDEKVRKGALVDTRTSEVFVPKSKLIKKIV